MSFFRADEGKTHLLIEHKNTTTSILKFCLFFFVMAVSETYTFILKGIEEVSSHLSVLSGGPRLVAHTQVTGRVLFQKVSNANNKVFFFF